MDARTDAIDAFAWGWTGPEAWALQSRLALDPADLDRWDTLSPGERKRWQIGAALAARPTALLLDEPTNHLDAGARELLLGALADYDGLGIVVSHDRALLRCLPTAVARLVDRSVQLFPGPWEAAQEAWAAESLARERQLEAATRAARQARQAQIRARQEAEIAQRARSLRGVDPKDHDARSSAAKARTANAATVAARRAAVTRDLADRAAADRAALSVRSELGRSLVFEGEPAPKARLLAWTGTLRAGDRVLADGVQVAVDRGAKVWLRGANGTGKSTLIRTLLAASTLPEERVVVVPQALGPAASRALLDRVRALPADARGRVMTAVAALGVDPARLLASEAPSPGEARKLAIADGLGRGAWLLVLDEPGNHLDLPSVQRLEQALRAFRGAVLLVSHDADFGRAIATRTWTLEGGRLSVSGH